MASEPMTEARLAEIRGRYETAGYYGHSLMPWNMTALAVAHIGDLLAELDRVKALAMAECDEVEKARAETLVQETRAVVAEKRVAELEAVIDSVRSHAKNMRNARKMVGPAEYHDNPAKARIWEKVMYHTGKGLLQLLPQKESTP